MSERNFRVQARYDELMREGKRGHYETMFRVVREEVERALSEQSGAGKPPDVNSEMLAALRLALNDYIHNYTHNDYVKRVIEAVIARAEAAQASGEQHP